MNTKIHNSRCFEQIKHVSISSSITEGKSTKGNILQIQQKKIKLKCIQDIYSQVVWN